MDSILTSIKKQLGIHQDYEYFDEDVKLLINSAFSRLSQLGVGGSNGYQIESADNTWDEFYMSNPNMLPMVKSYIYMSVRIVFDPPTSSYILNAFTEEKNKLEWLLSSSEDGVSV